MNYFKIKVLGFTLLLTSVIFTPPLQSAKVNLLHYIEKHDHQEVTQLIAKFQTQPNENPLQEKLLKIYERLDDARPNKMHETSMHKIIQALKCCHNPETLDFFKTVVAKEKLWILKQEAVRQLRSFPVADVGPFLLQEIGKDTPARQREIIQVLGALKFVPAVKTLCQIFQTDHDETAMQALLSIAQETATVCLKMFVRKYANPRSPKDRLLLAMLFKGLLKNSTPLDDLVPQLFNYIEIDQILLKKISKEILSTLVDTAPTLFLSSYTISPQTVKIQLLPMMARSRSKIIIEHLSEMACCAPNIALRHTAKKAVSSFIRAKL